MTAFAPLARSAVTLPAALVSLLLTACGADPPKVEQTPEVRGEARGPLVLARAEVLRAAKSFTNVAGVRMVRIPGTREQFPGKGTFTMGSPTGEADRDNDEKQHEVEVSEFYLGAHEVTQKQFRKVMGYNPSNFSKDAKGKDGELYVSKPGDGKGKIPAGDDTEEYPVENVSWEEAKEFCKSLNEK